MISNHRLMQNTTITIRLPAEWWNSIDMGTTEKYGWQVMKFLYDHLHTSPMIDITIRDLVRLRTMVNKLPNPATDEERDLRALITDVMELFDRIGSIIIFEKGK